MKPISLSLLLCLLASCGATELVVDETGGMEEPSASASNQAAISCAPRMSVFPVGAAHNIGYDAASCSGGCAISCPDQHANSDWGGSHHGIDVFAFQRAPLVAVASGTIVRVGTVSSTSGLRVRLRDACGWEYYYGHMDQAVVTQGQTVQAGQLIGYMGRTGTSSTHLHFNVSPDGNYSNDINPFNLLNATSPTACAAPPPPPPPPPAGCGTLGPGEGLVAGQALTSCDGRFTLAMQGDGNVVLYQGGTPLWHTGTNGTAGHSLQMQGDGNLVLYTAGGVALWHTFTFGHGGASLAVQDDGNMVLYQGGTALWHTQTCCH
jgi:hypothetical protein